MEALAPQAVKAYQGLQRQLDNSLVEMGAVKPQSMEQPAKAPSQSSPATTQPKPALR